MRPKATNIATNIPAFLSKLWKIVNDPDTDHLICWSSDGRSFIIQNQAQFWYNLLPIYYKHNNMSSFIRQLNMYGFHKISSESGGVECDRDELKFYHQFFQQDQPNLMKFIKRKMASNKTTGHTEDKVTNVDQMSKVLVDVKQLRGRQESVDNQLAAMKQENSALWRELALLRQKHMKQQQIVNKLIHFLVHIVNPNRGGLGGIGVKRRYPLMINDAGHSKLPKTESSGDGPTIHELDAESSFLLNEVDEEMPNDANQTKIDSPPSSADSLIEQNLLDIPIIENAINSPDDTLNSDMLLAEQELDNNELVNKTQNLLANTEVNSVNFPLKDTDLQEVISDKDILQAANEYIDINTYGAPNGGTIDETQKSSGKHILNPSMRDAMISNLVSGTEPPIPNKEINKTIKEEKEMPCDKNLTVATRNIPDANNTVKVNSVDGVFRDDLDTHLESTQGELESIKDMLFDGYPLDANALLGNQNQTNNRFDGIPFQLFNPDEDFPLDIPPLTNADAKNGNNCSNNYDPMMSGSELTSYSTNQPFVLDFENLFEGEPPESAIDTEDTLDLVSMTDDQNQLSTPVVIKKEPPSFPTTPMTKRNYSK